MFLLRLLAGPCSLLAITAFVDSGRAAPLAVLDDKPVLQVDAGGPSSAVTALAFSPDGKTLYAAGLDKVVRVWTWQETGFILKKTLRVPIGPGTGGAINAIAISPDGAWLAVAGRAPMRGETGFQRTGVIVEAAAIRPEQLEDAGVIYLVNTSDSAAGKVLRGHRGEVRSLAFAPARSGKPPLLVSTANERAGAKTYGAVRLWDAESGKLLAQRNDLPTRVEPPPGLVVWHSGNRPTEVRVAIAWPMDDDLKPVSLRIWKPDLAATEPMDTETADLFARPLALLEKDGKAIVLVGGLGPDQGRLRMWRLGAEPPFETTASFQPHNTTHFVPDAIVPVSVAGDGKVGHAAVLLRPSTGDDKQLALVDLANKEVVAQIALTNSDRVHLPVVAAAPRGQFIAVADSADHAIKVFATADLLRRKAAPAQVLESAGLTPSRVAFVDKGHGLWLSEDAKANPLTEGLHFDFDKGKLAPTKGAELVTDTPASAEWTIERVGKTVRALRGDKALSLVPLKDKEVVTAAALRPPGPMGPALLAVAVTDRDNSRTLILLCRPEDGAPFRLLIGHLQDVGSLAFSASRPLLASVAEDQTVCVWGLNDLDKVAGQIAGLGVADVDGKTVVRSVEPRSAAAQAGLMSNDVLEAVGSVGGELQSIGSAAEFRFAIGARRPDERVEVRVQGKKNPVTLTIDRGIDGRKPLFSLFLLGRETGMEWVGWSPIGPYDASSDAAEACVGWHTNTGNPAAPVEFVKAGEHRQEYYRHGILGLLAEEVDLGRALKRDEARRTPPEPALQPRRPDNAAFTNKDDVYLIHDALSALQVGINADYALTDAHVLKWSVRRTDGGKVTATATEASESAQRNKNGWEVNLTPVQWQRGEYQVNLVLTPSAGAPSVTTKSVVLRYQPAAPKLSLRLDGKDLSAPEQAPLTVMDDKLTLKLLIDATPGQKVDVAFNQWVNGRKQDGPKSASVEAGEYPQVFALSKGVNRLAVRAVNAGALAGYEADEATAKIVWVRYDVPNELPPRFAALKFERAPDLKQIDKKDVWVVDQPRVRVDVRIEGDGALTLADWAAGAGDPKSLLPERDAGKVLDTHIEVDLKAGEVIPLRLRAKTKNSELNTADLAVVYHPPFPAVTLDALKSPDFLTPTAVLSGKIRSSTPEPFDVVLRVTPEQGSAKEAKEFKAIIDGNRQAWKASVTLPPGRNKVEAFVQTKWRGEQAIDAVKLALRYRRLPRIVEAKEVTAVESALVDLPLLVESPAGMPVRQITVEGNHFKAFKAIPGEEKEGRVTWQLVVPQVPVCDEGRKLEQLHVLAHNDDGPYENESPVNATIVRVKHKVIPKAADARFLRDKAVNEPRPKCKIPYRIDSESPLVSVEIRRGEEVLHRADLKKVKQEDRRFVLEEDLDLTLKVGPNNLELIAINAGGRSSGAVVVNVLAPSVRVVVDRIEVRSEKGESIETLKPLSGSKDEIRFEKVSASLVWLAGRVIWSDPEAKQLDANDLSVVVLVRGCRQFPVELQARGRGDNAAVREFAAPVALTDVENAIKIEVKENRPSGEASVGQEALSRGAFTLTCTAPVTHQRLHLLIVGVGVKDGEALTKRVLDTLGATERPAGGLQGEFKTEAFQRSILYRVLIGEVQRGKVEAQLVEINKEIALLHKNSKWLNDVILVYYQGEDVVKRGERWLKTSFSVQFPDEEPEVYGIPCRSLPREAGTPLLLLNVVGAPQGRAEGPGWGGDPEIGLLRYAWSDAREPQNSELLLQLLEKALRTKSRLGDVTSYLNDLIGQQPKKLIALVLLGPDQADRKVGAPR
jgi:WD40 repeat protein